MPEVKRVPLVAGLVLGSLVAASMPVLGQESEEFVGPDAEAPLSGYTRSDGIVVLSDESFCRYLLGSVWSERKLTYLDLLDRSKKQRKARRAAFDPGSSEAALTRCVDVLNASRTEAPDGDTLPAWALGASVLPDALAGLLPEDFVAQPLAQHEHIGEAARTSGFGGLISAPFSVAPGPWMAQLDASACDSWQGTLHDARDPSMAFPLADSREYLYELSAGHYYWDVTAADCDWSVDLVPVQLGPVPTPTPKPQAVVPALFVDWWDRATGAENPDHLTAPQAREAVFEAGLVPGTCHTDTSGARTDAKIWQQEPVAGWLVDFGTTVDIWVGLDCDIYEGSRVKVE